MLGKKLVSTTYRLSSSWALQFTSSTEAAGSAPNRQVPDPRGPAWCQSPREDDARRSRAGHCAGMTNSRDPERAFRLNTRPLIVGGVLMGLGGVLGLAGIVVSGSAMAAAVRDWANRQEVPPSELARHHWARAKAATVAGAATWRNGTQEHAPPLS
jgi:hypothetical protein